MKFNVLLADFMYCLILTRASVVVEENLNGIIEGGGGGRGRLILLGRVRKSPSWLFFLLLIVKRSKAEVSIV